MQAKLSELGNKLTFQVGNIRFETWQVLAIVVLLFLLVFMMASVRRHFLEYSIRGAGFGVILGFVLAIVVEGILLVGGRTVLIQTFGWKNPPKPIEKALEAGRERFSAVLGVSTPDEPCE